MSDERKKVSAKCKICKGRMWTMGHRKHKETFCPACCVSGTPQNHTAKGTISTPPRHVKREEKEKSK